VIPSHLHAFDGACNLTVQHMQRHIVRTVCYAGRHDRPWTDTVQCAWNEPTKVAEA
ncbi:unnamed protein product, partial [Effrenium voratum]